MLGVKNMRSDYWIDSEVLKKKTESLGRWYLCIHRNILLNKIIVFVTKIELFCLNICADVVFYEENLESACEADHLHWHSQPMQRQSLPHFCSILYFSKSLIPMSLKSSSTSSNHDFLGLPYSSFLQYLLYLSCLLVIFFLRSTYLNLQSVDLLNVFIISIEPWAAATKSLS